MYVYLNISLENAKKLIDKCIKKLFLVLKFQNMH